MAPAPSAFPPAPAPSKPLAPLTGAVFEPLAPMPSVPYENVERPGLGMAFGFPRAEAEEEEEDAAPLPKLEMSLVRFHANNPSWQPSSREQQALLQSADLCVGHALAAVGAHGAGALLSSRLQSHSPGHLASLYHSRLAASSLSLASHLHSSAAPAPHASLIGGLSSITGGGELHSSAAPGALYASQLVGNEYLSQNMSQSPVPLNPHVYMVCYFLNYILV